MKKLKVGIVSFTDPRAVRGIDEINRSNIAAQNRLSASLRKEGVTCIVPLKASCVDGKKTAEVAIRKFLSQDVDALVFGCWKWTDPMLAVDIARRVDKPILLYGDNNEASTPLGCIAAVGAALWEIAPTYNAASHARIVGDFQETAAWARGVGAVSMLRKQSLLLWGGSYCLKMPHLEDDPSALKSFLVGDILTEDQYFLIDGAEKILRSGKKRIADFINWLKNGGTTIEYDGGCATAVNLKRQVALYLSARDRLVELEAENIGGVSIKCQPALSERYGVTGCLLPAFIPFGEDSEGPRDALPTVCEGDIKGLVSSMLLRNIAGGTPPGFGDIRHVRQDGRLQLLVSNCGAASAHYADVSGSTRDKLSRIKLKAQCQGAGGCAVGYSGPGFGAATLARLIRCEGEYIMQYVVGESIDISDETAGRLGWGDMWPLSLFDINLDIADFASRMGSNHYSFVPGDYGSELIYACRAAGIKTEDLGSL